MSSVKATELAQRFEQDGVTAIVYTDISRDGMMQGVNVEATVALAQASTIPVIASGGVTNMDDIRALKKVAAKAFSARSRVVRFTKNTLDLTRSASLL